MVTAYNPFTNKILDRVSQDVQAGEIEKIVITETIPRAHWSHLVVEIEMIEGRDEREPRVRLTRLLVNKQGTVLLQRYSN